MSARSERSEPGSRERKAGPASARSEPGGQRRGLVLAVLGCLAGAGLALFAATRTWAVEVAARPAPLPPVRTTSPGGALLPWLPALAVVGLAGAGALVATRAASRRAVAVLLLLVGVGLVVAGGYGLSLTDEARAAWPLLCLIGGALVAGAGAVALRRGAGWPGMGARYERRVSGGGPPRSDAELWDAFDRGEDPTER